MDLPIELWQIIWGFCRKKLVLRLVCRTWKNGLDPLSVALRRPTCPENIPLIFRIAGISIVRRSFPPAAVWTVHLRKLRLEQVLPDMDVLSALSGLEKFYCSCRIPIPKNLTRSWPNLRIFMGQLCSTISLTHWPRLQELQLRSVQVCNSDHFSALTNLYNLNLHGRTNVELTSLVGLPLQRISGVRDVRGFSLLSSLCQLTLSRGDDLFVSELTTLTSLTFLDCSQVRVSEKELQLLTNLRTLKIGPQSFISYDILCGFPRLQRLTFRGHGISNHTFRRFGYWDRQEYDLLTKVTRGRERKI